MGLAGFNRARRWRWNTEKAWALAEKEARQKGDEKQNDKNSARYDRIQALGKKTVAALKEILQGFPQGALSPALGSKKADLINAIINVEFQPDGDGDADAGDKDIIDEQ